MKHYSVDIMILVYVENDDDNQGENKVNLCGLILTLTSSRYVKSVSHASSTAPASSASSLPRKNKLKKATQEKRQERKAAKTLSAILLVFILTWTPYNVLAVMKAILGQDQSDMIPEMMWNIAYCLCYINSTINPFCYALCNAAFRRTYIRILTFKWRSSHKQPGNTYYYG